ncbi:MAG: four helix bundle protein [Flavobacteriia bacterium]|nr:four helix bundle protein [Flavobacteriia bacterium]
MHRFKEFEFWKKSRELNKEIYLITNAFPDVEKFGLISQLRSASVSISSNIAEGCSRRSYKDFYRFLEIAIGSAYEVESQLLLALDLEFIEEKEQLTLVNKIETIVKMMSKYMSTLK